MTALQIDDPCAEELARQLADRRRVTMSEAVVAALEAELARETEVEPLIDRIRRIADDLAGKSRGGGRVMSKDEIDAMWGQ